MKMIITPSGMELSLSKKCAGCSSQEECRKNILVVEKIIAQLTSLGCEPRKDAKTIELPCRIYKIN